jgi:hypothetical protein
MAKAMKKQADNRDKKLSVDGSFGELIQGVFISGKPSPAPKPVKHPKNK